MKSEWSFHEIIFHHPNHFEVKIVRNARQLFHHIEHENEGKHKKKKQQREILKKCDTQFTRK